uniref:Putative secreted protein n=1 Tax=Anopheles marajoara TaxID=58244 RepID=A0A2M4CEH7_9DIPT
MVFAGKRNLAMLLLLLLLSMKSARANSSAWIILAQWHISRKAATATDKHICCGNARSLSSRALWLRCRV